MVGSRRLGWSLSDPWITNILYIVSFLHRQAALQRKNRANQTHNTQSLNFRPHREIVIQIWVGWNVCTKLVEVSWFVCTYPQAMM